MPERYGPRTTLYNQFFPRRKVGAWDRLLDAVSKRYDGDIVMIDSSCVRVHQYVAKAKRGAADLCMGCSRGGLTTKIHAPVDTDIRPVRLELAVDQAADAPMAEKLLSDLLSGATIPADKAPTLSATLPSNTNAGRMF